MDRLRGKTALVTGASRGIGRGRARRLARHGALVPGHHATGEPAAKETVQLIERDGGRAPGGRGRAPRGAGGGPWVAGH